MDYFRKIGIIGGCGHIGLPLGLVFASKGIPVTLLDINESSVHKINEGFLPFVEEGAEELLKKVRANGMLEATVKKQALNDCTTVVFVTGTPVDEHLNPKVSEVTNIVDQYLEFLEDKLIVMRSTLYPGTLNLLQETLEQKLDRFHLAFCPERIVQGKGLEEIETLPQIVSGATKASEQLATDLFLNIASQVVRLHPMEAECAKLMTNSWRYLEFSIANQFYTMATSKGLNFWRIFEALKHDYPRAKHFPKPGLAAGPCLFKDTMQIAAFHDNQFFLGHSGMMINEGLPSFLVQQLETKLERLNGKNIAILGMTFKPNNDDTRDSLSFKIKKLLEMKLANVIPVDPYLEGTTEVDTALELADGVIMGVPHKEFLNLSITKPLVDCWGTFEKHNLLEPAKA